MRGYSVKNLFLLIFAVILCVYSSYTTAAIRTFSHNEKIDYGPKAIPRAWKPLTYDDGTIVLRIARRSSPPNTNSVCFIELFSLRIIYPNGLVEEKDIKLEDIQPLNYCVMTNPENGLFLEFLDFQLIRKNQILVTYHNATDINDKDSYVEWGEIIDFDGNVKDRISFGPAFVKKANSIVIPSSEYYMNINKEKGFLRFSPVRYTNNGEWQQYDVNPDGKFRRLTGGILPFAIGVSSVAINVIPTTDEGYAIIFANTTDNFTQTNPLLPQAQLFVLPIGYNQMPLEPLLLYQSPVPNLVITSLYCGISFVGVGQVCTVTAEQNVTQPTQPQQAPPQAPPQFYIKVNFLSSGSVSSFRVLNRNLPTVGSGHWRVINLPFGGYLFSVAYSDAQKNQVMNGYLFDEGDDLSPWELSEPQQTNVRAATVLLPNNNTFMLAQKEINNSWGFLVIDFPKYTTNEDNGYSNLNVNATYPAISETISSDTQSLSIDFYDPVSLSDGKLTIYQQVNGTNSVRQFIPAVLCSLNNDDKTLSAKVLDSTFSVSKGDYFITMDNDFVRSRAYNEPLLGIRENVWSFTTEDKKETFAPQATGLFRLTSNGTQIFDGYSKEQQHEFFNGLLDELALAVPISRPRLNTGERIQLDNTVNEKQYLISIGIKETRVESEISVDSVIKTLNTMVRNKDQTVIGTGQKTIFLDPSYGFDQSPDLWNKYKFRLLGVFLIIGLLIVLFLFAQRRDSNGNNIAILQLGVIIFDLVMDILFVSSNAKDLPVLYIPSVVFITVPIAVNTILAFYIITQEIHTSPKFHKWFANHGRVASVFTVLAGADIEALNILHSNLAGFPFFRAPFSDTAKSTIFWSACLNIFTEDIPQVAIQVYYRNNTVSYDIIPLLTLISSAVNLTINIIGRLYQATIRVKEMKKDRDIPNYNPPNDNPPNDGDDFGGFNNEHVLPRDVSDNKNAPEKQESHDESTSKGTTKSELADSSPQDYLGVKLNSEELGLGSVLNDSFNSSGNLGNDQNKNQKKGMTFLKRMVSRKEGAKNSN